MNQKVDEIVEMGGDLMLSSVKTEQVSSLIPEFGLDSSQIQGTSFSCNFCDDKFTNRLKIAMHYVLNHQLRYCSICTILFASDYDKEIHENSTHYPLKCTNCRQEFFDNKMLKNHYANEHSIKLCDFCPTSTSIEQYPTHVTRRHAIQNTEEFGKPEEIFQIDRNKLTYLCFMCLKGKKLTEIFGHYVFYHNMSINSVLEYATKYSDILKIDGATSKPINGFNCQQSLTLSKSSIKIISETDICGICNRPFSDNAPKIGHDIFCKGFLPCIECDNIFSDPKTLNEHTNTKHKDILCKFGCEVKLNLNDIQSHIQLIHDITACILCGLVTSSCSNKLNSHLKEKHNVDLQIYEKCDNKNGLYRVEGKQSKKVLCNFCNNDITQAMDDLCNLISHYESVHGCNKNAMIKKLEKNPILDLLIKQRRINIPVESKPLVDYLKYFQELSCFEKKQEPTIEKSIEEFDTNLIYCVASDTSDDGLSDNEDDDTDTGEIVKKQSNLNDEILEDSSSEEPIESVLQTDDNNIKQNKRTKKFVGICQFCGSKTMTVRSLFAHMQTVHGFELKNIEPRCSLCKIEFSTVHCLARHNKRKHTPITSSNKKGFYECPFCTIESKTKGSMRKHIKEHVEIYTATCSLESIGFKCRYCVDLFWSAEQRNNHHIEKHSNENGEEIMICYLCGSIFISKSCLRRHVTENHPEEEKMGHVIFKCSLCKITYTNIKSVSRHMTKVHPDSKSLYCSAKSCKMKIGNYLELEQHYDEYHSKPTTHKEASLKCTVCEKSFKNETSAISHYQSSHENKKQKMRGFKCRLCEMEFRTSDDRKLHCLTDHVGEKVYRCTTCEKGFSNKSGLYTHIQIHSTAHQRSCPYCAKVFNRKDSYNEHLLIHQGPQHQCAYCPKTFVQRSNLIRHTRIHTGEKPYKCTYCDKTFSDRGACSSHERVHTREEVSNCPYCNKSFSKKQKLRYHIRTHTKENLQTCDICSKSFTNSHSLKVHKMIHDRVTSIPCKECSKTFSNEKYMKRHMTAVHMKNSEFACHVCGKNFGNKSQMREHLMTHGSGKHISCLLCDFQCSSAKNARTHLIKIHGIDKEQTPLRDFIYIKTPEEEGILPTTSSNITNLNNDCVNNYIDIDDNDEDAYEDDDKNMDDESSSMADYLQPEVILESGNN